MLERVEPEKVFGYWLRYEYKGRKSFRRHVNRHIPKKYRRLIKDQDLTNPFENEMRYAILLSYRKFASDYRCAEWWEGEIQRKDLNNMLVIHAPHWAKLSNKTLKAVDIAKRVNEFESLPEDLKKSREVRKITENSKDKVGDRSMLIVVRTKGKPELTVIDGVHRAIRYCLHYLVRKDKRWEKKRMYLGIIPKHELHNTGVKKSIKASKQ